MARDNHPVRVYIREAAEILDRRIAAVRKWEQLGVWPKRLIPHRGPRNWRYWTPEQIEGLQKWIRTTERRPGKGLSHWHPSEAQIKTTIGNMRKPNQNKSEAPRNRPGRIKEDA